VKIIVQATEGWVLTPKIMGDRNRPASGGDHRRGFFFVGHRVWRRARMLLAIPLTAFFRDSVATRETEIFSRRRVMSGTTAARRMRQLRRPRFRRHAHACPECGADERTGWRETSVYDDLDLPESAFEDQAAPRKRPPRAGLAWYWVVTAVVAIIAAILFSLGSR